MSYATKLCAGHLTHRLSSDCVLEVKTRTGVAGVLVLTDDIKEASAIYIGAPTPYYLMDDGGRLYAGKEADRQYKDELLALIAVWESAEYDNRRTRSQELTKRNWEVTQARYYILEEQARSFLGIDPCYVVHLVTLTGTQTRTEPVVRERPSPYNVIIDVGWDWVPERAE